MISMVLYGRNDDYGYNLPKRGAIGLNCMAEVLTAPDDELLFVDYNTPNDCPTFPEAIADTLTENARRRLRVLRVRPEQHARFAALTHLPVIEPIARNVAIRRANPANRWILATNIEMVFVPRAGDSLSELVADLPGGYYGIPRFEVPESLWESFDRLDPVAVLRDVASWGRAAVLNEVVPSRHRSILYDAPGDFQLVERADLFAIKGFDERMVLGWHVDTNLFRRLSLCYDGATAGDLSARVFGYHCNHYRQPTASHARDAPRNDFRAAYDVTRPELRRQRKTWGLKGETIEEIRLPPRPAPAPLAPARTGVGRGQSAG